MKFTKMHGCGNDYVYVDLMQESVDDKSLAALKLSDRHFGIGGDGVIYIQKGKNADFEMVMYNADGSRGAMCGNGIRCVAKYCYDNGLTDKTSFTIESMGAVKYIDVNVENGEVVSAKVDMGTPSLDKNDIPVNVDSTKAIREKITIDEHPRDFNLEKYGKLLEQNATLFPDRVNAEFAKIIDRKNIEMRVWERGAGETLACGTGACATAVAAIVNGFADNDVTIHLIGGDLQISWSGNESDSVFMTGGASTVFTGDVDLSKIK